MTDDELRAARDAWLNGDDLSLVPAAAESFLPLVGAVAARAAPLGLAEDAVVAESMALILYGLANAGQYRYPLDVCVRYALVAGIFSLVRGATPEWTFAQARAAERAFMGPNLDPAPGSTPPVPVAGWLPTALARFVDLVQGSGPGRGLAPRGPSVSGRLERLAAVNT